MRELTHGVIYTLLLLLGGNAIPAHQRLPPASDWTDFPLQLHEGSYRRRARHDEPQVKMRTNFLPELQRSVDNL